MSADGIDMAAYDERRRRVQEAFRELPHGAQTLASFDLRITLSMVSGVLNGRYVDEAKLDRLEAWVNAQLATNSAE